MFDFLQCSLSAKQMKPIDHLFHFIWAWEHLATNKIVDSEVHKTLFILLTIFSLRTNYSFCFKLYVYLAFLAT